MQDMAVQSDIDYAALCKHLKEKETKVRYWRVQLIEAELIEPRKGHRNKWIFSPNDVTVFETLKEMLDDEEMTVTSAIRLLQDDVTPEEALQRYRKATREVEVLQKKVLDLRRPPWWEQIGSFFKKFWQRIWGS